MKLLTENWAQISFILIAFGYVIKSVLESAFKKKELKFSFFLTQRMELIQMFISTHSQFISGFTRLFERCTDGEITAVEFEKLTEEYRSKLESAMNSTLIYTSKEEDHLLKCIFLADLILLKTPVVLQKDTFNSVEIESLSEGNKELVSDNNLRIFKVVRLIQKDFK